MEESKEVASKPDKLDCRTSIIAMIQSYFTDSKDKKKNKFEKYMGEIKELVDSTSMLIDEEIKNLKASTPKGEYEHSDTAELEQIILEEDPGDSKEELLVLRDQMILSEMEQNHPSRYQELSEYLGKFIAKQLAQMKREIEELTYFLEPNDPQIVNMEQELTKTHSEKLRTVLLETDENFPEAFIFLANELFEDSIRMNFNDNKAELTTESEIANFIEEWAVFFNAIQENIYQGSSLFWDKNILENDTEYVSLFLNLFLYSQQVANSKESEELKICYTSLSKWIISEMEWASIELDDLMNYYDAYALARTTMLPREMKSKCKEITKITYDELNIFKFKFIIFHFGMFLTSTVNQKGKYEFGHYNPGYRHFLYNFLASSFEKSRARKLLQILEKSIGEFIKETLKFEYQDPIDSPLNQEFRVEEFGN